MKKLCLCIIFLHPILALNIAELVTHAQEQSEQLAGFRTDISVRKELADSVYSDRYPTININGYMGNEREKYIDYDERYSTREISFKITQPLFDFGGQSSLEASADIQTKQARLMYKDANAKFINDCVQNIIKLKKHRTEIKYQEYLINNISQKMAIMYSAAEVGGESAEEIMKIEILRNQAIAKHQQLLILEAESVYQYEYLFGQKPQASFEINLDPDPYLPQTLEDALDSSKLRDPLLHFKQLAIENNRQQKKQAQSKYMPSIDISAEHTVSHNVGQPDHKEKKQKALINVNYEIPTGMGNISAVNASNNAIIKSKHEKDALLIQKDRDISRLWHHISYQTELQSSLKNAVKTSSKLFENKKIEYSQKAISEIEFLQSESEHQSISKDFVLAKLELLSIKYNLLSHSNLISLETLT